MPHPATPPAPVEGSEYRLSEVIAARMTELFAADDLALSRDFKRVD
jgi:hypothetical protein